MIALAFINIWGFVFQSVVMTALEAVKYWRKTILVSGILGEEKGR